VDPIDEYREMLERETGVMREGLDKWLGNHVDKFDLSKGEYIEPGVYKDEYGIIWDKRGVSRDVGDIKNSVLPEPDLSGYELPEVDEEEACLKCEAFFERERNSDSVKFIRFGSMLFERAWFLRGFEEFLTDLVLEERFASELLEKLSDRVMRLVKIALRYDFDGVYFGDDYGHQRGLLMSPALWRKVMKPILAPMFQYVRERGRLVAFHSCGDLRTILGDLCDIGLDIYQTVQPEIYDLAWLKKEFGKDLTFWGAVSTQTELPMLKAGELKPLLRRKKEILGEGGGFIIAPTHRIIMDVPLENFLAMLEVFQER